MLPNKLWIEISPKQVPKETEKCLRKHAYPKIPKEKSLPKNIWRISPRKKIKQFFYQILCLLKDFLVEISLRIILGYPTPIPLENQVGWPLYKTISLYFSFFLILHCWQYRLNIQFFGGCFLDGINMVPRSGFWFSRAFSRSLLRAGTEDCWFYRFTFLAAEVDIWFLYRLILTSVGNGAPEQVGWKIDFLVMFLCFLMCFWVGFWFSRWRPLPNFVF